VFGAYLCPLCSKTYKYEYNLFFHWRKTCQYLNELVKVEQRKNMDVESLRLLVEEVVVKRSETEPVDIGISSKALFQGPSSVQLEMPIDPQSPLARACMICGILVHRIHLPQHEALHSSSTETGLRLLDMQSPTGGFYCDLCGVAFRRKDNLYTHWRSSCPEIMANIEPGSELFLSDMELKAMVLDLLMRLRRMSRQSPLRPHHTNRDDIEEDNALSHQLEARVAQTGGNNPEGGKGHSASSASDEKAMVYMDDYVNPADTVVDINGELVNVVPADRRKWNIPEDGKPIECPDCFRQFANAGRLERHISGFHSHYGAYKCLLCGHRFKYDYNLLFHYRHSCAYTKLLLDAASLRKLVSHIKQTDPDLRPG
ncbi:zinc finger, C2H2 type, partial [Oesophagostomum dentatum]